MGKKRIVRIRVIRRREPEPPEDPPPAVDDLGRAPPLRRDAFYRAELTRNAHLRKWSWAGAGVVLVAFAVWFIEWNTGCDWGLLAIQVPTYGSLGLCLVAMALGAAAVRSEASGATAEVLIMTPASRRRIVRAKALAALEPIILPALLLGVFYLLALPTMRGAFAATDILHGGLLRLEAVDPLPDPRELAYWEGALDPDYIWIDAILACGALTSDFSWYLLCAAWGVNLAAKPRISWLTSVAGFALLAGVALVIEVQLSNAVLIVGLQPEPPGPPGRGWWGCFDYYFGCFRGWMGTNRPLEFREGPSLVYLTVFLWSVMVVLRGLFAAWLLRRAARRFDQIVSG